MHTRNTFNIDSHCSMLDLSQGPRVYLVNGKNVKHISMERFTASYKSPPGSHVELTPSGYMTDVAWKAMAPKIGDGIRKMPVIKDHPQWWCLLSLDGFSSHMDPDSLEVFAKYHILVIKEELDASQVCQAYDQIVAKHDKRLAR